MNTEVFFCDTYALIEILGGNPNYAKYLNCTLVTSEYNLMELYYAFLKDYNQQTADKYFDFWVKFSVQIPLETIKQAMIFRLTNRKDNLSYVDCIGYIFSQQNGIKFLTGDRKFENKHGVEFVK
jgi:predicted nucleic acid-binding protein